MVVALTLRGDIITIDEYKYAINQVIHSLPAGLIEEGEKPLTTAQRELLEETGYSRGSWEYLGEFYDYPTKDSHAVHFVKATGVSKTAEQNLDETENINVRTISQEQFKTEIKKHEWKATATISALVAAGLLS